MSSQPDDAGRSFEAARKRLLSIAHRLLGSRAEAEDVVQDAWFKWQAADRGALHTPLAWLTTVTTRLALDRLRRLQTEATACERERAATLPVTDASAPSAEDEVLRIAQLGQGLALVFERLSADERAAFVLHEAFDCDYAQIASALGKTPAHCRQLVHRARQRLRRPETPLTVHAADAARPLMLEALVSAIETSDLDGALRVFAGGAQAVRPAARCQLALAQAADVVQTAASLAGRAPRVVRLAARKEADYLALFDGDGLAAVIAVSWVRRRVARVDWLTDATTLDAIDRLFGARAIRRLLAATGERVPA